MPDQWELRRAAEENASDIAELWLRSYNAALPTVRRAHTDDEVRAWFQHVVVPSMETWIAVDKAVAGMMVLHQGWIEQLYLDPDRRGQGLGAAFVALAKERNPGGLQLWTFQVNEPAQRFYARHGFVAVERTDGTGNEEREPDVRYAWQP